MKRIIKIVMTNFLGFENRSIDLPAACIIIGPNESGKSTILKAIEFVMSGRITGHGGRSADLFKCFRGDGGLVSITFLDSDTGKEHVATRGLFRDGTSIKSAFGISPNDGKKDKFILERDFSFLPMAFDFGDFTTKSEPAARKYILGLIGNSFLSNIDDLVEDIRKTIPGESRQNGADPASQLNHSLEWINAELNDNKQRRLALSKVIQEASGRMEELSITPGTVDEKRSEIEEMEKNLKLTQADIAGHGNWKRLKDRLDLVIIESIEDLEARVLIEETKLVDLDEILEAGKTAAAELQELKTEKAVMGLLDQMDPGSIAPGTICPPCQRALGPEDIKRLQDSVIDNMVKSNEIDEKIRLLTQAHELHQQKWRKGNSDNAFILAEIKGIKNTILSIKEGKHSATIMRDNILADMKDVEKYSEYDIAILQEQEQSLVPGLAKEKKDLETAVRNSELFSQFQGAEVELQGIKESDEELNESKRKLNLLMSRILAAQVKPLTGIVTRQTMTMLPDRRFYISSWDDKLERQMFDFGLRHKDGETVKSVSFEALSAGTKAVMSMAFLAAHYELQKPDLPICMADEVNNMNPKRLESFLRSGCDAVKNGVFSNFIAAGNIPYKLSDLEGLETIGL